MFFLQTGLGLFIKEALRIDRRALLLFFPALFFARRTNDSRKAILCALGIIGIIRSHRYYLRRPLRPSEEAPCGRG